MEQQKNNRLYFYHFGLLDVFRTEKAKGIRREKKKQGKKNDSNILYGTCTMS